MGSPHAEQGGQLAGAKLRAPEIVEEIKRFRVTASAMIVV